MDLETSKTTVAYSDKRVFANTAGISQKAMPVTVVTAAFTEATHFPDGFIPPGTILARFRSGANQDLWGPYVHDDSSGEGRDNADAMVWEPIYLDEGANGSRPTRSTGSVILADIASVAIDLTHIPGLLDDADAAHTPVAADLPSGFFALELGV